MWKLTGEAHLLGGRPHRVPGPVGERGQAEGTGILGEDDAPVAGRGTTLHLGQGGGQIPERQRGHGQEPVGCGAGPLGLIVVVGLQKLERHAEVVGLLKQSRVEEGHVGIEDLGKDAVFVHSGQAGLGFPRPWVGVTPALGMIGWVLGPTGLGGRPDRGDALVADDPGFFAVGVVPCDVGDEVAPTARHPRGPEIRRLDKMGIGVDDTESVHDRSTQGNPPFRTDQANGGDPWRSPWLPT